MLALIRKICQTVIKTIKRHVRVTWIVMEPGNRMLRPAIGRKNYRWFIRLDLWRVGVRITRRISWCDAFEAAQDNGFTGTLDEWLSGMKGPTGPAG